MNGKVGRNDPCPCGSGVKYKKCCGRAGEVVSPPDRRVMERDFRALEKLLAGQEFETLEDANTYLDQITARGDIPEWVPETPMEQAQELIYQALEATDRQESIRLAMEALEICPDCPDAYVLLAEEASESLEQVRDWCQRGVEAGERALGPEVFANDAGHFWSLMETRPYMWAREGLADSLWLLGEGEAALEHYRDMLRLNPNDNQGIRYKLLCNLMESSDFDAAEELLGQYETDWSAAWLYSRALVAFIRQGDSPKTREQLKEAVKENPHVPPYLLGRRRLPRTMPDYIGFGDKDEAVVYVAMFAESWQVTPGALEWVKSQSPETPRRRVKGQTP